MVTGARGTIAGTIFSANKAGPFARGWSRGSNPRSTLQTTQRATWTEQAVAWAGLTQAQRDDWIDYADDAPQELTNSLGETYFASGFAWFVRINTHLVNAGAATRVDAPTLVRPIAPVLAIVELYESGSVSNTHSRLAVASTGLTSMAVCTGRVVSSQGINPVPLRLPLITIEVPDVNRFIVFESEVETIFGEISLGQRFLYTQAIQDAHGQRGPVDSWVADAKA